MKQSTAYRVLTLDRTTGTTLDQYLIHYMSANTPQRIVGRSAQALEWLRALGSTLPPENIIPPNFAKSRSSRAAAVRTRPESQALELLDAYPNPTSGSQWLVYSLPEGSEQASIQIQDALGRVVMNTNVALGSTMLEVSTNTWNSGLYMARILADDMAIGNLKLIVKR